MQLNLTQKILNAHIEDQNPTFATPVEVKIDQTLTQDATGTMAYIQLEAMGVDQDKNRIISLLC